MEHPYKTRMKRAFLIAAPDNLHVHVHRTGEADLLRARLHTSLPPCAAYRYLTDYDSAILLTGIIDSRATRAGVNKVTVECIAEEQILFMRVRLHSVLEFTEHPDERVSFTQISGDSKSFHGDWLILPAPQGSTLTFDGRWEPDTLLPLFIIDHFAQHELEKRFDEISRLAEEWKTSHPGICQRPDYPA